MKKNTYYVSNSRIRRFDTTWKWRYDIHDIKDDTIFFNGKPDDYLQDKTWWFNGNEGITKGTVSYTYSDGDDSPLTHETFEDITIKPNNPNAPWLEYDNDGESKWNNEHPYNKTRFLTPDFSYLNPLSVVSTIENVTIDTEPPILTNDNTQYLVIGNTRRKCSFEFTEETAIDFKNFSIKLGDTYLYRYERKTDVITYDDGIINVSLKSDALRKYVLEFIIDSGKYDADILNEKGLTIEVYDVAGNNTVYKISKQFIDIEIEELNGLEINFYNPNPSDRIISSNVEGEVWVDIFNPNESTWSYFPIAFALGEGSIGTINENTIDYSTYEADGHIRFKVDHIAERGYVIVDAWIYVDDDEWSKSIKSSTNVEGTDGPWILMDDRNRLYDFKLYIPNALKNTEFGNFTLFVEKFLNTYYLGASQKTNISALEKTARILDFNDIKQIEKEYLSRYANELGNELDISFEDIMNMDINSINANSAFGTTEYEDAVDEFRYIIENLPYYNQLKGSVKGMQMMLRMMGLCVTFVNLWLKTSDDVETNPVFFEESQILDISNYFMSSYFSVNTTPTADFRTFNDNMKYLINILQSIKPINRALEKIKYTVMYEDKMHVLNSLRSCKNDDVDYEYNISWFDTNNGLFSLYENVNENSLTADGLVVPFNAQLYPSNILYKFADKNVNDICIFAVNTENNKTEKFIISGKNCKIKKLDEGILITDLTGVASTNVYKIIDYSRNKQYELSIKIIYKKGTDYILSKE